MMIKEFIEANKDELYRVHKELCLIPAPSHFEDERAEYCKKWFLENGAENAYIDEAKNVVLPINCEGSDEITVFVAHTDTVFPDREPMPFSDDGDIIRCPGVGDDTAGLAVLMLSAKYLIENNIKPKDGLLIVCNSCEEGLGNLKGTRQIFKDFEGRIKQFISYDAHIGTINDTCVGSHRYEVTVKTEGGHSYGAFGNKNAIAELSKIITEMFKIEVPKIDNSKTTYNVGTISGGTSVNTIAQEASMLCEYRSDNVECLSIMKEKFEKIFEDAKSDEVEVLVKIVGERPCAKGVDEEKIRELCRVFEKNIIEVSKNDVKYYSSSTDCNIPLSLGIPAICTGVYSGGGTHTREEWIEKESLIPGLELGIKHILSII